MRFDFSATLLLCCLLPLGCGSNGVPQTIQPVTPTPLSAWQSAYENCKTQVVNVVVFGDSRAVVDTTITPGGNGPLADTFGNRWADLLRETLQAKCGSHGTGLVPFLWDAEINTVNGDFYTVTGAWARDASIGPSQGGSDPTALTVKATAPFTITFAPAIPFDHLAAYCASGPGLSAWQMTIDGQPAGTCGGSASVLGAVRAVSGAVSPGIHTATFSCQAGTCEGYGLEGLLGETGVSVHDLAVGSCAAECFGLSPGGQLAYSDLIGGSHQLVVASLITNEPGVGYSTQSFGAAMTSLIDHERSLAGSPSVLVYAPLQDMVAGQAPYYPVLAGVASTESTAYFDMRDVYGSAFLPAYFGPDQLHENNQGHAAVYSQVSAALLP